MGALLLRPPRHHPPPLGVERPKAGKVDQPRNEAKYMAGEAPTITIRIRQAAKPRKVTPPDPDEFLELMDRVRKTRR